MNTRTCTTLALGAVVTLALSACGTGPGRPDAETRTLTVYAAASLTETFDQVAEEFEAENDDVTVRLSFAGSSDLVAQLRSGAPADVFAAADEETMARAVDDGLVEGDPAVFATNVLQIATPPDNPADVESLADLARTDVQVVLCAPAVPCGSAADRVQAAAGLAIAPVSEEQAVTDVLGKVISGEADAGLVYATDVIGAGDAVLGIEFAESDAAVNAYPIGALVDSDESELAAEFVTFVLGEQGQQVLTAAGFGPP